MANFDDLQGAVAQFGANNKVIFDDTGMPSIMVAVPKAKYVKKPYGYDRKDSTNRVKGVIFRSCRQEKD